MQEKLEDIRVAASRSSPMMETVNLVSEQIAIAFSVEGGRGGREGGEGGGGKGGRGREGEGGEGDYAKWTTSKTKLQFNTASCWGRPSKCLLNHPLG